jgi:tRNA pseudouridine38-40 synthase
VTVAYEPTERCVKLTLHYDGEGFAGWQIQPGERTVQAELETGLSRLTDRPARVIAAGRTDRGVHATGQVISALVPSKWTPFELRRALNAVLPRDMWVAAAEEAPLDFHARYDAFARGYVYRVGTEAAAQSPFLRRWCWPIAQPLAPLALKESARRFIGTHSFQAFAKSGQPERGERCTVWRAEWRPWSRAGLAFHVVANRFLHHMVRSMVGTMVDIARDRRAPDDIDAMLLGTDGVETSPPAPPEGLFLTRVYYDLSELQREESFDEVLPG